MIPKIIHFCWLSSDKYPPKIQYCIESWKKKLPDYEIRLWNLSRFDIHSSVWCQEAYEAKKYAFAADYIRCYALYTEGGIYLDSDVEVVKSFDDLLKLPYFIGEEQGGNVEPAIIGCEKGWILMRMMLDYYKDRHFLKEGMLDMATLPNIMSEKIRGRYDYIKIFNVNEFIMDATKVCVFSAEYFSPKFPNKFLCPITSNTYAIHHFSASWYPIEKKLYRLIRRLLGYRFAHFLSTIIKKMR